MQPSQTNLTERIDNYVIFVAKTNISELNSVKSKIRDRIGQVKEEHSKMKSIPGKQRLKLPKIEDISKFMKLRKNVILW